LTSRPALPSRLFTTQAKSARPTPSHTGQGEEQLLCLQHFRAAGVIWPRHFLVYPASNLFASPPTHPHYPQDSKWRVLKEHFGQRGMVTDAKLLRTKNGGSRVAWGLCGLSDRGRGSCRAGISQPDFPRHVAVGAGGGHALREPVRCRGRGAKRRALDLETTAAAAARRVDGEPEDGGGCWR